MTEVNHTGGEGEEEKPDVQKKVFGRWIAAKLKSSSSVTDLYYDLQDGTLLLDLIVSLTGKDVKREQVC